MVRIHPSPSNNVGGQLNIPSEALHTSQCSSGRSVELPPNAISQFGEVSMTDGARRIIKRAAAIIRRRGWCKNVLSRNGRVCAQYALGIARSELKVYFGAHEDAINAVLRGLDHRYSFVSQWNDDPETKRSDVLRLLDRLGRKKRAS